MPSAHTSIPETGEAVSATHPSAMREQVSLAQSGVSGMGYKQKIASIFLLAILESWIFVVQFRPEAFVFDVSDFSSLVRFQEITVACFLLAIGSALLFRQWSVKRWAIVGDCIIAVSLVSVGVFAALINAGALSEGAHLALSIVNHVLLGLSVGMAFCNWVRLYVCYEENVPLLIGLSLILAGIVCAFLCFLEPDKAVVAVSIIPVFVLVLEWYMRATLKAAKVKAAATVMEGPSPIGANKRLWIGVCSIGFVCGTIAGYVLVDVSVIQTTAAVCAVGLTVVGAGISVYYIATGKNPGYSMTPTVLMGIVCCGYAIFAAFQGEFASYSFGAVFCGQMMFECMILMQLPRIYRKLKTLNTFFAIFLAFRGSILAGVLLRHLMMLGAVSAEPIVTGLVTAVLLCGGIIALSYMSSSEAVSTAWDLFPLDEEQAPRKRYASACESIRETYGLTAREEEIMRMVGRGRNGTFVQEKLVISKSTYQTHMRNLYKKLDIHSDQELIDIIEEELNKQSL